MSIYHRRTVSRTPPCPRTSNHSTSSSSCKFKDTGGGQDGARQFIKESKEGDGRLWRKKMSLERRVKERMRRSRAKSKRKIITHTYTHHYHFPYFSHTVSSLLQSHLSFHILF